MPKSTRSYELYERADDVEHLNFNLIVAFDALNLFAVITLSAIFLTAYFSSQIRRVSTWYLYIFSWAVFSLGYLLILGHQTNSQPGHGICLVQSMFIYATPAFASSSIVVFVAQIYLDLKYALILKPLHQDRVTMLVAIPWSVFVAILGEVFALSIMYPDTVERHSSGMYCHLSIPLPCQITGAVVLISIITMIIFGVLITVTIRRNRDTWQTLRSREPQPCDLMLRIALFILAPVIATGVVLLELLGIRYPIDFAKVNVVYAILPATAGLIFSSQRDILRVWKSWLPWTKKCERLPDQASQVPVS